MREDTTLHGKDREIVDAVRERGLDWLFYTLYENYCVEVEYIRKAGFAGKKSFKVRVVELARMKTDKKIRRGSEWQYQQSFILMAGDCPEEIFKEWPKQGDLVKWGGRLFGVSHGYQLTCWFHPREERLYPAIRIFVEELAEPTKASVK